MTEWLSDEEINKLMPYAATEPDFVHRACAQAKEANRLRAGLEKVTRRFEVETQDDWRASVNKLVRATLANKLRKILEGGE